MPNNHRQFVKVRKEGGSRVLALTPFLPPDWKIIRVIKEDELDKGDRRWIRLRLEKVV